MNGLDYFEQQKAIKALRAIAQDMADDARHFDGKPFTGANVAEYFGNQGAAIAALAGILRRLLESQPEDDAAVNSKPPNPFRPSGSPQEEPHA